jgi:iron complex outermembrane receptor protein
MIAAGWVLLLSPPCCRRLSRRRPKGRRTQGSSPIATASAFRPSSARVDLRGEVGWNAGQEKAAPFELPAESPALDNAYLAIRPFKDEKGLALRLAALNLSDEEARVHASFLKDGLPLPGRNFRISLAGRF